jgi:signal transduction histidine kinase
MRTLLMELRPDAMAEADLKDLLRHLVNAFIARARIPARFTMEGTFDLPLDQKTAFYRIAQEALNNIAKHSEASHVTLTITCTPDDITMVIADDGQGFDCEQAGPSGHYGLRIMTERAEQAGAALEILSQCGQGTQVIVRKGGLGVKSSI